VTLKRNRTRVTVKTSQPSEETMVISRMAIRAGLATLAMGVFAVAPQFGLAQVSGELEPGKILEASTDWEGQAAFSFMAGSAGVLTVAARSLNDTDLMLMVTDSDGQPLPDGGSDQDLGGDVGAEQFAVTIPRAGEYKVIVETFGGGDAASFQLGASWLPFPRLEVPADPDGSPGAATRLVIGQDTHNDIIDDTAGDYWDWFVLKADKAGTLTVATRTDGGDLVLEAFEAGEFTQPLEHSDQDLQGNGGNEAVTLVVDPGQEFFFRVSAFSEGVSISYRLQVGFIPALQR
jgi:hypothetical protein